MWQVQEYLMKWQRDSVLGIKGEGGMVGEAGDGQELSLKEKRLNAGFEI